MEDSKPDKAPHNNSHNLQKDIFNVWGFEASRGGYIQMFLQRLAGNYLLILDPVSAHSQSDRAGERNGRTEVS